MIWGNQGQNDCDQASHVAGLWFLFRDFSWLVQAGSLTFWVRGSTMGPDRTGLACPFLRSVISGTLTSLCLSFLLHKMGKTILVSQSCCEIKWDGGHKYIILWLKESCRKNALRSPCHEAFPFNQGERFQLKASCSRVGISGGGVDGLGHGTYTTWDRLRAPTTNSFLRPPFWAAFSPFHSPPQMEEPVGSGDPVTVYLPLGSCLELPRWF